MKLIWTVDYDESDEHVISVLTEEFTVHDVH